MNPGERRIVFLLKAGQKRGSFSRTLPSDSQRRQMRLICWERQALHFVRTTRGQIKYSWTPSFIKQMELSAFTAEKWLMFYFSWCPRHHWPAMIPAPSKQAACQCLWWQHKDGAIVTFDRLAKHTKREAVKCTTCCLESVWAQQHFICGPSFFLSL